MKLVQFWHNNAPALGLQTPQGIVDVQAEAARRGVSAPADMAQAIALGDEGLSQLAPLAESARCFTQAPPAPVVTQTGRILCIGLNYRRHAKECGLPLTGAGSAYPYHKDPQDSHLRIAPTYPSLDEVETASELLCVCVRLAVVEKLLADKAD